MAKKLHLGFAFFITLLCSLTYSAKPMMLKMDEMPWGPGLASQPKGAEVAILSSSPDKHGPFIIRIKFPPNYQLPPHTHPTDEHSTVIAGILYAGFGTKIDKAKTRAMPAGSFITFPAKMPHFGITGPEGVTVQLDCVGPWIVNYINAADDPRKNKH
jgi:quercetin dioxygenase-like cupin family protein